MMNGPNIFTLRFRFLESFVETRHYYSLYNAIHLILCERCTERTACHRPLCYYSLVVYIWLLLKETIHISQALK